MIGLEVVDPSDKRPLQICEQFGGGDRWAERADFDDWHERQHLSRHSARRYRSADQPPRQRNRGQSR